MPRRVKAGGTTWDVRVRWMHRARWRGWRPRRRPAGGPPPSTKGGAWDWAIDFAPLPDGLGWVLVAIATVAFMIFVGGPLLILLFEQLALVLLGAAGALVRLLVRRPWAIEATRTDVAVAPARYDVVGLRAAWRARDTIASAIERTGSPPERVPPR